jgi:hypothetical protein
MLFSDEGVVNLSFGRFGSGKSVDFGIAGAWGSWAGTAPTQATEPEDDSGLIFVTSLGTANGVLNTGDWNLEGALLFRIPCDAFSRR